MFNYGIISTNGIKTLYLFCQNKPHFMLIKISVGPKMRDLKGADFNAVIVGGIG